MSVAHSITVIVFLNILNMLLFSHWMFVFILILVFYSVMCFCYFY